MNKFSQHQIRALSIASVASAASEGYAGAFAYVSDLKKMYFYEYGTSRVVDNVNILQASGSGNNGFWVAFDYDNRQVEFIKQNIDTTWDLKSGRFYYVDADGIQIQSSGVEYENLFRGDILLVDVDLNAQPGDLSDIRIVRKQPFPVEKIFNTTLIDENAVAAENFLKDVSYVVDGNRAITIAGTTKELLTGDTFIVTENIAVAPSDFSNFSFTFVDREFKKTLGNAASVTAENFKADYKYVVSRNCSITIGTETINLQPGDSFVTSSDITSDPADFTDFTFNFVLEHPKAAFYKTLPTATEIASYGFITGVTYVATANCSMTIVGTPDIVEELQPGDFFTVNSDITASPSSFSEFNFNRNRKKVDYISTGFADESEVTAANLKYGVLYLAVSTFDITINSITRTLNKGDFFSVKKDITENQTDFSNFEIIHYSTPNTVYISSNYASAADLTAANLKTNVRYFATTDITITIAGTTENVKKGESFFVTTDITSDPVDFSDFNFVKNEKGLITISSSYADGNAFIGTKSESIYFANIPVNGDIQLRVDDSNIENLFSGDMFYVNSDINTAISDLSSINIIRHNILPINRSWSTTLANAADVTSANLLKDVKYNVTAPCSITIGLEQYDFIVGDSFTVARNIVADPIDFSDFTVEWAVREFTDVSLASGTDIVNKNFKAGQKYVVKPSSGLHSELIAGSDALWLREDDEFTILNSITSSPSDFTDFDIMKKDVDYSSDLSSATLISAEKFDPGRTFNVVGNCYLYIDDSNVLMLADGDSFTVNNNIGILVNPMDFSEFTVNKLPREFSQNIADVSALKAAHIVNDVVYTSTGNYSITINGATENLIEGDTFIVNRGIVAPASNPVDFSDFAFTRVDRETKIVFLESSVNNADLLNLDPNIIYKVRNAGVINKSNSGINIGAAPNMYFRLYDGDEFTIDSKMTVAPTDMTNFNIKRASNTITLEGTLYHRDLIGLPVGTLIQVSSLGLKIYEQPEIDPNNLVLSGRYPYNTTLYVLSTITEAPFSFGTKIRQADNEVKVLSSNTNFETFYNKSIDGDVYLCSPSGVNDYVDISPIDATNTQLTPRYRVWEGDVLIFKSNVDVSDSNIAYGYDSSAFDHIKNNPKNFELNADVTLENMRYWKVGDKYWNKSSSTIQIGSDSTHPAKLFLVPGTYVEVTSTITEVNTSAASDISGLLSIPDQHTFEPIVLTKAVKAVINAADFYEESFFAEAKKNTRYVIRTSSDNYHARFSITNNDPISRSIYVYNETIVRIKEDIPDTATLKAIAEADLYTEYFYKYFEFDTSSDNQVGLTVYAPQTNVHWDNFNGPGAIETNGLYDNSIYPSRTFMLEQLEANINTDKKFSNKIIKYYSGSTQFTSPPSVPSNKKIADYNSQFGTDSNMPMAVWQYSNTGRKKADERFPSATIDDDLTLLTQNYVSWSHITHGNLLTAGEDPDNPSIAGIGKAAYESNNRSWIVQGVYYWTGTNIATDTPKRIYFIDSAFNTVLLRDMEVEAFSDYHLTETAVSPVTSGFATDAEIESVIDGLIEDYFSGCTFYYTGTDTETDTNKKVFIVLKNKKKIKIYDSGDVPVVGFEPTLTYIGAGEYENNVIISPTKGAVDVYSISASTSIVLDFTISSANDFIANPTTNVVQANFDNGTIKVYINEVDISSLCVPGTGLNAGTFTFDYPVINGDVIKIVHNYNT